MHAERYGIILNVEHYRACVDFYQRVLLLPVLFQKESDAFKLTCLAFGDGYLMIETEGMAVSAGKTIAQCPMKLRFNVTSLEQTLAHLHTQGVEAAIEAHPWGSVINLFDPDGNRIGIRDEASFFPTAE